MLLSSILLLLLCHGLYKFKYFRRTLIIISMIWVLACSMSIPELIILQIRPYTFSKEGYSSLVRGRLPWNLCRWKQRLTVLVYSTSPTAMRHGQTPIRRFIKFYKLSFFTYCHWSWWLYFMAWLLMICGYRVYRLTCCTRSHIKNSNFWQVGAVSFVGVFCGCFFVGVFVFYDYPKSPIVNSSLLWTPIIRTVCWIEF